MATRGRKPGFKMPEEHRAKIRITNILNALQEHVEGSRDMEATQITAAVALLRKVMPDLSAVDANVTAKHAVQVISDKPVSPDEWEARYSKEPGVEPTVGTSESTH